MAKHKLHPALTSDWENARRLDAADPLASYRELFSLGGHTYLDGNSLGLLSKPASDAVTRVLHEWGELAIEAWLDAPKPWFTMAERVGALAAPLVGAKAHEVIACGSTSSNLHSLISTLYLPSAGRSKIISDCLNFSSDIHVISDQIRLKGLDPSHELRIIPSRVPHLIDEADVYAALDHDVALLVLSTVQYRSGQLFDIAGITREAHAKGVRVIWDASHSAGSVPHEFHAWGVDGAVFCGYKYLNGGPGSTGFLFIHERHHHTKSALSGWFGHRKDTQFQMRHDFEPAPGASRYQISTPHVLSLAPLEASLEMFASIGREPLRSKSLAMTELLMSLGDRHLSQFGLSIVTPRASHQRGGHVAFAGPQAYPLAQALRHHRIIPDFRPPDILRLAPVALYNTYSEIVETVSCIVQILENGDLQRFEKATDIP